MTAVFSGCRTWRYTLTRPIDLMVGLQESLGGEMPRQLRTVLFVCLNPSTADEQKNDPTVRRCMGFAERWRFERLVVCNIFALRSTDPAALYKHPDPVGSGNDVYLIQQAVRAEMVVMAWGNHGRLRSRGDVVRNLLYDVAKGKVHVLGFNASEEPKHPLYLRADTRPVKLYS